MKAAIPEIRTQTGTYALPPLRIEATGPRAPTVLTPWLRAQSINVTRHAAALRPFRREEFGGGAASPSEGHIQAVNTLMTTLRRGLLKMSQHVTDAAVAASAQPVSS